MSDPVQSAINQRLLEVIKERDSLRAEADALRRERDDFWVKAVDLSAELARMKSEGRRDADADLEIVIAERDKLSAELERCRGERNMADANCRDMLINFAKALKCPVIPADGEALPDFYLLKVINHGMKTIKERDAALSDLAAVRERLAALEKEAAENSEALTITYMQGSASRNDEVRALQRDLAAAEKSLALIGERAVVDFDDATVGAVDAVVEPRKYSDWLREIMGRANRCAAAEKDLAEVCANAVTFAAARLGQPRAEAEAQYGSKPLAALRCLDYHAHLGAMHKAQWDAAEKRANEAEYTLGGIVHNWDSYGVVDESWWEDARKVCQMADAANRAALARTSPEAGSGAFSAHLRKAAEVVAKWPLWKRESLGPIETTPPREGEQQ